jgi:hypothetical protein
MKKTNRKPAAKLPAYTPAEQAIIAYMEAEERRMRDLRGDAFMIACEAEDEGGWAL